MRNVTSGRISAWIVSISITCAATIIMLGLVVPSFAECSGQFTPMAGEGSPFTEVHFFPKNGNKIVIAGQQEIIPPGVGVISGGVIGNNSDASVDKVTHQSLSPLTLYYTYVYMADGVMMMDFSRTGHMEDQATGVEVNATDTSRSLVGMVRTDDHGKFIGNAKSQLTLSWCNRVNVGLMTHLEDLSAKSSDWREADQSLRIEWLQWGINSSFLQGSDVPDLDLFATVSLDVVGACAQVRIGIDDKIVGSMGQFCQRSAGDAGEMSSHTAGWGDEGYHYGQVLVTTTAGSKASFVSGLLRAGRLSS